MTAILPLRINIEQAPEAAILEAPTEEIAQLGRIAMPELMPGPDTPPVPKPGESHINQLGANEKGVQIYELFDRTKPGRVILSRHSQSQATMQSPHTATGPIYYGPRISGPRR